MKAWNRFNKYYIAMLFILLLAAGLVIYTFNGVFSALDTAYEVDTKISDLELRIDRDNLNEAYEKVYNRDAMRLEME